MSRHSAANCPLSGDGSKRGNILPPPDDWQSLDKFDAVLLHHDNTLRAQEVAALSKSGLPVYIFYPSYRASKHGALKTVSTFPSMRAAPWSIILAGGPEALFGGTVTMITACGRLPA